MNWYSRLAGRRPGLPWRRPRPAETLSAMKRRIEEAGPGLHTAWDRGALFERLRARMRTRHMSPRTITTYLSWVRRFLAFHGGRNPVSMGRVHIERFIEQLAERHGLGAQSQNQAASAIVFLYRELYGIDHGGRDGVVRAQQPKVLPRYASPRDVEAVLRVIRGPQRVGAMIMYGSGARVSEVVNLRIKDVSLRSGELAIRGGKGRKDRITVLPQSAVQAVRDQILRVEEQHIRDLETGAGWARLPGALHRKDPQAGWEFSWQYLFPSSKLTEDPKTGRVGRLPMHVTTLQRAVKAAAREVRSMHPITCHVLRHCFATEMLRSGCDIRLLQRLMGHKDLKTTSRYLHIVDRPGLNVISPLDRLPSFRAELEELGPRSVEVEGDPEGDRG